MKIRVGYVLPVAFCLTAMGAIAEPIDLARPESVGVLSQASAPRAAPDASAKTEPVVLLPAIYGYYRFIRDVYQDHERYLKRVRENPDDKTIPPDGYQLAAVIGISLQDFLTVQVYALQAYQQIEANSSEETRKGDEIRRDHMGTEADLDVYSRRHIELMQNLISNLQKELSQDAFKRLDDHILRSYRQATTPSPATPK